MITLRNFTDADISVLQQYPYRNVPFAKIQETVHAWNQKRFQGTYFEMFAILNPLIIGTISLYQHAPDIISCGLEIFPDYRRQGFGKEAMTLALNIAKSKGYGAVTNQVRSDNIASIALHQALHFVSDGNTYKNQKGNDVLIYQKTL